MGKWLTVGSFSNLFPIWIHCLNTIFINIKLHEKNLLVADTLLLFLKRD